MYTHRYYAAVTAAKELVGKYVEENDDLLNVVMSGEASYVIRSNSFSRNITAKAALASVLASGTFLETGQFMMPSTRACLDVFRHVRKQLSNQRPILLMVADGNHDIYPVKI